MKVENYLNDVYLTKLHEHLDDEIGRVKLMLNQSGFHNGTAIGAIVRRYRNELKQYDKIVMSDLQDVIDGSIN